MTADPDLVATTDWKKALPTLASRHVLLRELAPSDLTPLMSLLSLPDATHFGVDGPGHELAAQQIIDRAARERASGAGFTYAITIAASRALVGVFYVHALDPAFEAAAWDCAVAPASRGSGVFIESAQLVGSLVFGTLGAHRLEARVPLSHGRSNGAMKKLGAVQEGILRRALRRGDTYHDQALWSILKEDWGRHWVSIAPRVH
ncbi:MAG: GNAT family N-acetyltransferase [Acidobacteria bacterium]|nr:GNAT family N-acetyltransferase [Acidobacteriota bacterium]